MNTTLQDYLAELSRVALLGKARAKAEAEWGSDIPTTVLFSALGRAIVDAFASLSPNEQSAVFCLIESGVTSSDIPLRTYVASGLLEALYSRGSRNRELWPKIEQCLLPASRAYLAAWCAVG